MSRKKQPVGAANPEVLAAIRKEAEAPVEAVGAEIVQSEARPLTVEEEKQAELRKLEDGIFHQHLSVVSDSSFWTEVTQDTTEPPAEWVAELGYKKACQRLRVAKANWYSAKEAPVGIAVSQRVVMGMVRARSMEKHVPRTLNVSVVQMTAPPKTYPSLRLEKEGKR